MKNYYVRGNILMASGQQNNQPILPHFTIPLPTPLLPGEKRQIQLTQDYPSSSVTLFLHRKDI